METLLVPKGAVLIGRAELSMILNALSLDEVEGRPVRGEMVKMAQDSIERLTDKSERISTALVEWCKSSEESGDSFSKGYDSAREWVKMQLEKTGMF